MQPQGTAPCSTHPAPTAAFEAYCARRAYAYSVGEAKARQREISADAYLFLYKELVGLAGERTYCWPGLAYLASSLATSVGTLKRWMKELEQADLIRRQPRPGGQTSLTFITAYLAFAAEPPSAMSQQPPELEDDERAAADHPRTGTVTTDDMLAQPKEIISSPPQSAEPSQTRVLCFGPEQEIASDRCGGSTAIPHTVKTQESENPGTCGGGIGQALHNIAMVAETAITALLDKEAVHDAAALNELQHKPLAEMRAISQYLDTQTNVRCRPALFVWLARRDFGAKLLAGQHYHGTRRGTCQGQTSACAAQSRPMWPLAELQCEPVSSELAELWQGVLAHLRLAVPKADYDTWIAPITLVALEDGLAVVATPNIFVREEVEQHYKTLLEAGFSHACGQPTVLQAVIG